MIREIELIKEEKEDKPSEKRIHINRIFSDIALCGKRTPPDAITVSFTSPFPRCEECFLKYGK